MTNLVALASRRAGSASTDVDLIVRSVIFIAVFLLVWVSLHPFKSLADAPSSVADSGDSYNQIAFVAVFIISATWMWAYGIERLRPLVRPAMVLTLSWFALSVLTSWEPGTSARRFVFTLIVLALGAVVLMLPRNLRHFTDLLAIAILVVLALSYLGLVLAPSLSIHQATDFLEPEHEGNWRGVFAHKNQAGGIMATFVIVGLYVARSRNRLLGGTIIALSAVFLIFTYSKSAIALLILVLALSAIITNVRRPWSGIAVALGFLIAFNLFSVGSIYFETISDVLSFFMPDATFTGRTDIWKFASDYVMERPITGYGFSAFWGTEQVVYSGRQSGSWAAAATDAHNAYLNLALGVGLPGLTFVLWWFVVLPIRDFYGINGNIPCQLLSIMFLRIWLIGIYLSSFESALFPQSGAEWFMYVVAVFGLRLLRKAQLKV